MLRFRNATAPTVFIQFQPNFMENMIIKREFRLLLFLALLYYVSGTHGMRSFSSWAHSFQIWVVSFPWRFSKFWKKKYIFKIFRIFFFVFVNMGPYGSQNFKRLLLPQITFESFQTFSEFSSERSSQKYCFGFLSLWFFTNLFSFTLTCYSVGAETSKHYSSLKSLLNLFNCVSST